jgi:hypothetical protein
MEIINKIKDMDNMVKLYNMEKEMILKNYQLELEKKDIIILKNNEIHEAKLESLKYQLQYKDLLIEQLKK